jgi:hypothetical protein
MNIVLIFYKIRALPKYLHDRELQTTVTSNEIRLEATDMKFL